MEFTEYLLQRKCKKSRLLVYDQHKAQTTKKVKEILQNECKTTLALAPPGATSKVQPGNRGNDPKPRQVSYRESYHKRKKGLFYPMDRAGLARDFSLSLSLSIVCSFVKCGIALPTSGQRNDEINLCSLKNYTIGHSGDMEHIWFHDDE